jgi:hypothetical protein
MREPNFHRLVRNQLVRDSSRAGFLLKAGAPAGGLVGLRLGMIFLVTRDWDLVNSMQGFRVTAA